MRLIASIFLACGIAAAVPVVVQTGSTFSVDFDGFTGSGHNVINGLTSTVTFSDFAFQNHSSSATRVNFRIDIENTSSSPITASRVSSIGFDTTPNIVRSASNSVTGVFNSAATNGNMPNGIGRMEFCFSNVNCAGGGSGGVTMTGTRTGTAYAQIFLAGSGLTSMTFDDIFVRYQSIGGAGGITSASGSVVPEPGAYAVLFLGMLAVWYRVSTSRRRDLSRAALLTNRAAADNS